VPTIDGRAWTEKRLRFLRGLLEENPDHEHRTAIEEEIAKLEASHHGRLPRWLRLPRLPHQRD
jgi:hypothetical protein